MSETPDPVEHRPRPGGRSARVVHDVLDAVLAELAERGYALLSMEAVAQRAGVNKTTIYRRWPTKPELVLHALQELSIRSVAVPETGTVREDLIQTLRQLSTGMSSPLGRNLMVRLQVESTNEEVAAIGRSLIDKREAVMAEVVRRAIDRGELPRSTDPQFLLLTLSGAVQHWVLRHRGPVPADVLGRLVDLVLEGARHGGGTGSRKK